MTNPLLGKHISLISKKNIRYEGVLYSINQQNATVALQNVRTFGTEGREKTEEGCVFVAPTDTMHPYLLFRGQDIKDLHVHDSGADKDETPAPQNAAAEQAASTAADTSASTQKQTTVGDDENDKNKESTAATSSSAAAPKQPPAGGRGKQQQRSRNSNNNNNKAHAVGTGASLLNRSVRGAAGSKVPESPKGDFDFQSKLEEFQKEEQEEHHDDEEDEDEAGDSTPHPAYNAKDDFFDSISCDALDKEMGRDNRLRGSVERQLNTETFGATALNQQRRRRGRGYHGGRGGGGRGRGRGRGRGGRGRGYQNQRGGGGRNGSGRGAPATVESS